MYLARQGILGLRFKVLMAVISEITIWVDTYKHFRRWVW